MLTKQHILAGANLSLLGLMIACSAPAYAANPEVQPATYAPPSRSVVKFSQQPASVGDKVWQQLEVNLDVSTTITQSNQIANQDNAILQRQQKRAIEVIEVAEGRVRRAQVSFPRSRQQSPENQDPTQLEIQAVEGKSYFVERQGERLLVTDSQGAIPPQKEFKIVVNSVQSLGLPNPLAAFLLQRDIHVGDRFQVPQELAEQIMGFGDSLGKVRKFELELKQLQSVDGQPCALFAAAIKIRGGPENPIEVDIEGQVVIQTETCRTAEAKLSGPLHMNASEQDYQVTAEGELLVAIRTHYGSAKSE